MPQAHRCVSLSIHSLSIQSDSACKTSATSQSRWSSGQTVPKATSDAALDQLLMRAPLPPQLDRRQIYSHSMYESFLIALHRLLLLRRPPKLPQVQSLLLRRLVREFPQITRYSVLYSSSFRHSCCWSNVQRPNLRMALTVLQYHRSCLRHRNICLCASLSFAHHCPSIWYRLSDAYADQLAAIINTSHGSMPNHARSMHMISNGRRSTVR